MKKIVAGMMILVLGFSFCGFAFVGDTKFDRHIAEKTDFLSERISEWKAGDDLAPYLTVVSDEHATKDDPYQIVERQVSKDQATRFGELVIPDFSDKDVLVDRTYQGDDGTNMANAYTFRSVRTEDEVGALVGPQTIMYHRDRNRYGTLGYEAFYRSSQWYPFYRFHMDTFYDRSNLKFMSYRDAQEKCEEILDIFDYSHEECIGYTISRSGMMKFWDCYGEEMKQRAGIDRNEALSVDDLSINEFYIFLYPLDTKDVAISETTKERDLLYAAFAIDQDGFFDITISPEVKPA